MNKASALTLIEVVSISTEKTYVYDGQVVEFKVATNPENKYSSIEIVTEGHIVSLLNNQGIVKVAFSSNGSENQKVSISAKCNPKEKILTLNIFSWVRAEGYPKYTPVQNGAITGAEGRYDYKYVNLSATNTNFSIDSGMQVFDNLPFSSDSDDINGVIVSIEKTDRFRWNGPNETTPTNSAYMVQFSGEGSISTNGNGDAGLCVGSTGASGSASTSISGNVSANGGPNDEFSLQDVGGNFEYNVSSSVSGQVNRGESPSISGSISGSASGTTSFARTGTFTMLPQGSQREFGGGVLNITLKAIGTLSMSVRANGCLLNGSNAKVKSNVSVNLDFEVLEKPKAKE